MHQELPPETLKATLLAWTAKLGGGGRPRAIPPACPHCGFTYDWNPELGICEGCGYPTTHGEE